MTMITLVCCLLALSGAAIAFPSYNSYATVRGSSGVIPSFDKIVPQRPTLPLTSSYGQILPQQSQLPVSTGYGVPQPMVYARPTALQQQQLADQQAQLQQMVEAAKVVTEADRICVGQQAETIIPLDNGHRYIVCLEEGKGFEQVCPRGLIFHHQTRRCERKLISDSLCASQPCLNGGQCQQVDISSYQCTCPAGFDGKNCELDAYVCQTQSPCGSAPDTRCQSFRPGAALKHVCIFNDGQAYGLHAQQITPNPCQGLDGSRSLGISDKGFIMCDGAFMYVESCPGGTIWDDLNKACVWPDMQGYADLPLERTALPTASYGQESYAESRPMVTPVPVTLPQQDEVRPTLAYGQQIQKPQLIFPQQDEVKPTLAYGQQIQKPQMTFPQQDEVKPISSYGQQIQKPQLTFPQQDEVKPTLAYGQQIQKPHVTFPQQDEVKPTLAYGQQIQKPQLTFPQQDEVKPTLAYGQQIQKPHVTFPQQDEVKPTLAYGQQIQKPQMTFPQQDEVKPTLAYGQQIQKPHVTFPQQDEVKPTLAYGQQIQKPQMTFPQQDEVKPISSYGQQIQKPHITLLQKPTWQLSQDLRPIQKQLSSY